MTITSRLRSALVVATACVSVSAGATMLTPVAAHAEGNFPPLQSGQASCTVGTPTGPDKTYQTGDSWYGKDANGKNVEIETCDDGVVLSSPLVVEPTKAAAGAAASAATSAR